MAAIKFEDLIHVAYSEHDWQINVPEGVGICVETVYKGNIDVMPLDLYFTVKDMYVEWCGEWNLPETEERVFEVKLTYDPDSESVIVHRYNQRKEWEERQKEYQAKLNNSKESENE